MSTSGLDNADCLTYKKPVSFPRTVNQGPPPANRQSSETASDKTTTPVCISSLLTNLVTTSHVHTPATYAFRTKGRFNTARGVTRELGVSWLAVGWRYGLLPLVMRGCGMPMVWATIFPNSSTCETLESQNGKHLINAVEQLWIHASPPMFWQRQPRTKGHPKTPCCVDPLYCFYQTHWTDLGLRTPLVVLAKNMMAILHEQLASYLLSG